MPKYCVENGDRGEVRLNNQIVLHALSCDTDEGWVEFMVQPLTIAPSGEPITTFGFGKVEFIRYV